MKVSIVIPNYKHYNLIHQLLFDLYKYCRDVDEVLVVDDASNDTEVEKGLEWWFKQKMLPIKAIWKQNNEGFLKTCNLGAKKATGDIIVLLSTDVRVKDNFIPNLVSVLTNEPKSLVGNRLIAFDSGWNTFNGKTYPYLEGWFIACTKDGWNDLGGFDETFAPCDFEDVDLSTTAVSKGYLLLSMDNPRVTHIGGQSIGFNPDREKITKAHKELFRQKWVDV